MKKLLIGFATLAMAAAFTAAAQDQVAPAPGQAGGGAPRAFGDRNRDGKCDITGQPVGQGRAQMAQQGSRGRMMGRRGGRMASRRGGLAGGMGMGMGFRGAANRTATPAPAQVQ